MHRFTQAAATLLVSLAATTVLAQHEGRDDDADGDLAQRREQILQMADATMDEVRDDAAMRELLDDAYGYAVFDTTKGGFLVTGAGGTGVAMQKNGKNPVFMHLGAAGVGLGAGIENYKLVMLFQDEPTYERFIEGAWSAGVSAQAAAGGEGRAAVGKFVNGVAVFHLTDEGVIAQVDATGVKFWPSDRLNPGVG